MARREVSREPTAFRAASNPNPNARARARGDRARRGDRAAIGALGVALAVTACALDGATRMLNAKLSAAVRDPGATGLATGVRGEGEVGEDAREGAGFARARARSMREHRLTYDFERDRRGARRRRARRERGEDEAERAAMRGERDDANAGEEEGEAEEEEEEEEAFRSWAEMLREDEEKM